MMSRPLQLFRSLTPYRHLITATCSARLPIITPQMAHFSMNFVVLLTLIPLLVTAAPTGIGLASTSTVISTSSTSHILAWLIPAICVTFAVLALAACSCSFRRRKPASRTSYQCVRRQSYTSAIPQSEAHRRLRISTQPTTTGPSPPPYTLSPCPESAYPVNSAFPGSPSSLDVVKIYLGDEENGHLLSAPSPIISRTGSPSLQIWTPPLTPPPPHRPENHA